MKMKLISGRRGIPALRHQLAFTLIELIVAMAIASLMIFLINRIFMDTTNAVSRGMGISQIIGESRAAMNTFDADLSPTVPLSSALPIIGPADGGFILIGFKQFDDVEFPNARRMGSSYTRSVQSDQLMLVVNNDGHHPLTPVDRTTFNPSTQVSPEALLWYGHVGRANVDTPASNPGVIREGDPGWTGTGNLRDAHRWVVGRQRLFLAGAAASGFSTVSGSLPSMNHFYATASVPIMAPGNYFRAHGVADVLSYGLTDLSGVLNTSHTLEEQYAAFLTQVAYGRRRLMVGTHVARPFEAHRVAQTHAAFMSNCSDFQISFAGDFDATLGIDVDGSGNIKWYGFPLNEPPSPPFPDKPLLHDPRTTVEFTNATPGRPFYVDRAAINTAMGAAPTARLEIDHAVVFRHDATDITKQWPHLIRIRYRLHDDRGEVESAGNNGEREQGMWFEQLIQVQ